jgi:hypothetical protein
LLDWLWSAKTLDRDCQWSPIGFAHSFVSVK